MLKRLKIDADNRDYNEWLQHKAHRFLNSRELSFYEQDFKDWKQIYDQ